MMKTKEKMMKEAIKMGLNAGAIGCVAVLSAEELEMLIESPEPPEKVIKKDLELDGRTIAQVYVDMIEELIDKLAELGYHIIINGESYENYGGFEIDHKRQVVDMITW